MNDKPLMAVLNGLKPKRRPIWFMRQAGRYLPEYREVRSQAGSFLDLCYNPDLATEVTLQPLRRFDLDAAILFADILLIPHGLGSDVGFVQNEGPVLSTVGNEDEVAQLKTERVVPFLEPVFETVAKLRKELPKDITLIGFCGAPWTVATYMIEGGTSKERLNAKTAAYQSEPWFEQLIDILVESSIDYLSAQAKAGAEVLQIFDSWAGDLDELARQKWVYRPIQQIVSGLREKGITAPIIGFGRGIGTSHGEFAKITNVQAIGVESNMSPKWIKDHLINDIVVQGNIDPIALRTGGDTLVRRVEELVKVLPYDRHIFNLGHGIRQETPISHVDLMIETARRAD